MDDTDDGRLQRQSDGPNTIPDEKSQHSTQNAGPIYRVINPADNRVRHLFYFQDFRPSFGAYGGKRLKTFYTIRKREHKSENFASEIT